MAKVKKTRNKHKNIDSRSAQLDRSAGKVLSVLRMSKTSHPFEIAKLKILTPVEDLFVLFRKVFQNNNYIESIYGPAFPARPSELFSKSILYNPADQLPEVIWAICRCLQFSDELQTFTRLREEYERSLLFNLKEKCYEILSRPCKIHPAANTDLACGVFTSAVVNLPLIGALANRSNKMRKKAVFSPRRTIARSSQRRL